MPGPIPDNCITATLLKRLHQLGWHITHAGCVFDLLGSFDLFDACLAEITLRAQWAWQFVVTQQVAHRPGFKNLQFADAADTRVFLKGLPDEDRELFHKCLNGCHITRDGKAHCQDGGSDLCPYCGCTDSRFHRFWVCERFAAERSGISADVWKLLPQAPDFLTGYGWSVKPHTLHSWYSALDAIVCPVVNPLRPISQVLHLFTDGGCMNQAAPMCRLAAWAVVVANGVHHAPAEVVDSGPLPGLLQSSYRAEIYAVIRALSIARLQHEQVCLWSDCSAVVTRLQKLLQGREPKPNSAHSDLWNQIYLLLQDFAHGQVSITKVAAHRTQTSAVSPLEEWCFANNSVADQAATWAQRKRPEEFWCFFDRHVQATIACQQLSREVQWTMLKISQAVVRDTQVENEVECEDLAVPPEVPADAWSDLAPLHIPHQAVRWYGDEVVRQVMSWFWQSTYRSVDALVWVSHYQLYIDFMLSGEMGPTKIDVWKAGRHTPHLDLLAIPFATRTRWFTKVLKECLRHHGTSPLYRYCRPESRPLFFHTGCIALPWCPERLKMIDFWILRHYPTGIHRTSKALDSLSLATKDDRFCQVWISSV